MAAELVINSEVPSAMPGALMLLLAFAVATLASYVSLDLARRVRVVRTRSGGLWLFGAAAALSLGIWSSQVIGIAAEPLPFALGFDGVDSLTAWAVALAVGLVGLGAVSGKIATHVRVGLGAFALGTGVVGAHVISFNALGLQPGVDWQLASIVAAVAGACGGCMMALGAFFRGGDRSKPPTVPWQATAALVLGATLVGSQQLVTGAAGLGAQTGSLHVERIASSTLALFASVGSIPVLVVGLILSILEARLRLSLRRAESELQRRSFRDGLTRLPNRLMFEGILAQACQQADAAGERMAMLFIDLDGFKPVNESLGHHMGDLMLREIATRLKRFARPDDSVAHLGGDEFLMLMRGNPSEKDASTFAERMQRLIGEPCRMNGREAAVTSSIGIAMFPEHAAMPDLIAHAEAAMRAAKSGGGAGHCFFEPRMVSGARDQFDLLRDLRRALAEGQLHLVYQPKVHAPTGEITGAEALMRWNHPQRGEVAPTVFIPIAERFGLIGAIGNWLIEEACRQAGAWRDEGLRMRVAINLSAHQLRHADLADRIDAALKRHHVNPQLLTCEITESVAMEDASNAIRMVEKLGAMGVNISIDDFGTGYSSLAYLRKLRAGELKIDRSFVMDLETSADARAVVDAVVKLAQALGLQVVAEGVETDAQNEILRALGCNELQGFLFARPMSAMALSAWAMDEEGLRGIDFRESLYKATVAGALH
jgi:diguanylate cyclase (GGDEF)-like protein